MESVNFFKALADKTRLRLLNLLIDHELNVNEIVEILDMGQSRISRHLKVLYDSGLVKTRRDGLASFYSAALQGQGSDFINAIKYLFNSNEYERDISTTKDVIYKRSKETTRFFDSIVGDWESLKHDVIGEFDLNSNILKRVSECNVVVDIGCGTGDLLPLLKSKAKIVIGVDKSPKMLDKARRRFNEQNGTVDLRLGEIEHLPLGDGEADITIANMVLHHLQSPIVGIQEIYRVMKIGGIFILADFADHKDETMRTKHKDRWLGFSSRELHVWLTSAGFQIEKKNRFKLEKGLTIILYKSIKK